MNNRDRAINERHARIFGQKPDQEAMITEIIEKDAAVVAQIYKELREVHKKLEQLQLACLPIATGALMGKNRLEVTMQDNVIDLREVLRQQGAIK